MALTRSEIIELYTATFNRAADADGVAYWETQTQLDKVQMANAFLSSDEAQNLYPPTQTTEEFITSIYNNLFGREPDADGLAYWTEQIDSGAVPKEAMIAAVVDGAHAPTGNPDDAAVLNNKTEVSTAAVDNGMNVTTFSLEGVTADPATVTEAINQLDSWPTDVIGEVQLMTTGMDVIEGTVNDDIFYGIIDEKTTSNSTLQSFDTVNGKEGYDTLNITLVDDGVAAGGANTAVSYGGEGNPTNVEKLEVKATGNANATANTNVDVDGIDGLKELVDYRSSNQVTFQNIESVDTQISSFKDTAGRITVAEFKGASLTGDNDTVTLNVEKSTSGTATGHSFYVTSTTTDGVENLVINSNGSETNYIDVVSVQDNAGTDTLKNVTIKGDADAYFTSANGDMIFAGTNGDDTIDGTIDASALKGKLTVTLDKTAAVDMKVIGSAQDDTINTQDTLSQYDIIDGGDGNDTLTMDATALDKEFTNVSNIETVAFNAATAAVTMDVSKLSAGVTTVQVDVSDATAGDTAINSTITNLNGQTVVVKHTTADTDNTNDNVNLQITNETDTAEDTLNVKLDAIGDLSVHKYGIATLDVANYETLNIESAASRTVTANEVETLDAGKAQTINFTGDADLTIGTLTQGTNTTLIDASALNAKFTATTNVAADETVKLAQKDSTFNFGNTLDNKDTVIGGAGTKDKVTATLNGADATTGALNISDVETVALTTTGDNTIDMTNMTGVETLSVTDDAAATQTIKNADLATTFKLSNANDNNVVLDITAADATGTEDTLNVYVDNTTNNDIDLTVKAASIETLALTLEDSDANVDKTTFTLTDFTGTTVTAVQSTATTNTSNADIDLGTLNKSVLSVDTSGMKAAQTFSVANATAATTLAASGADVATITGSAYNDTITVSETGNVQHAIDGGDGTADVLNIDVKAGFTDASQISNVETINMNVKAGDDITLTNNANGISFTTSTVNVNIAGGNSLSTFNTGTIADEIKTVNAADFQGNLVATIADDKLDSSVTITGGSTAKDEVKVTTTGTAQALVSTGVEILTVTNTGASATVDVSSATGLTTVNVDNRDGVTTTIDKMSDGQTVVVTKADDANSVVEAKLASATGDADTINFELKATAAGDINDDGAALKTTDIETVNLKVSNNDETIDLSNLSMATDGKVMTLNVTGDKALTISALNADVTTLDASANTAGLTMDGRSATDAMTITGTAKDDTIIMMNADDALNAGSGSDTLVVDYNAVLGGIKVDLSATDDQITTFNGSANAAVQTGFVNVDVSGYTGGNGADITANANGSKIIGTDAADQITGGAGDDIIRAAGGADSVDAGAGNDTLVVLGAIAAADYTATDVTATTGAYKLGLATLIDNGLATSDTADGSGNTDGTGETYNGGAGNDTLEIWGTADLTKASLSNIEYTDVHSNLTLTASQMISLANDIGTNFNINMLDTNSVFTVSGISGLSETEIQNLLTALDNTNVDFANVVTAAVTNGDNLAVQTEAIGGINYLIAGVANDGTGNTFFDGLLEDGTLVDYSAYTAGQHLFVLGTQDNNTIIASNNGDFIVDTGGTNSITGGTGNDIIVVTGGTNTITGGAGNDTITLGAGADTVVLTVTASADTVSSFAVTGTDDKLGFNIDANNKVLLDASATAVDNNAVVVTTVDGAAGGDYVDNSVLVVTAGNGYASTMDLYQAMVDNTDDTGTNGNTDETAAEFIAIYYNTTNSAVEVHYVKEAGNDDGAIDTDNTLATLTGLSETDLDNFNATQISFIS